MSFLASLIAKLDFWLPRHGWGHVAIYSDSDPADSVGPDLVHCWKCIIAQCISASCPVFLPTKIDSLEPESPWGQKMATVKQLKTKSGPLIRKTRFPLPIKSAPCDQGTRPQRPPT